MQQAHRVDASGFPFAAAGMAGVYDIETHLQYEAGRGVQYLSTMERAMGGRERFAAQSPAAILASAAPPSEDAARCANAQ